MSYIFILYVTCLNPVKVLASLLLVVSAIKLTFSWRAIHAFCNLSNRVSPCKVRSRRCESTGRLSTEFRWKPASAALTTKLSVRILRKTLACPFSCIWPLTMLGGRNFGGITGMTSRKNTSVGCSSLVLSKTGYKCANISWSFRQTSRKWSL